MRMESKGVPLRIPSSSQITEATRQCLTFAARLNALLAQPIDWSKRNKGHAVVLYYYAADMKRLFCPHNVERLSKESALMSSCYSAEVL